MVRYWLRDRVIMRKAETEKYRCENVVKKRKKRGKKNR